VSHNPSETTVQLITQVRLLEGAQFWASFRLGEEYWLILQGDLLSAAGQTLGHTHLVPIYSHTWDISPNGPPCLSLFRYFMSKPPAWHSQTQLEQIILLVHRFCPYDWLPKNKLKFSKWLHKEGGVIWKKNICATFFLKVAAFALHWLRITDKKHWHSDKCTMWTKALSEMCYHLVNMQVLY